MFCCFVLCDVVSVVLLLAVIAWLNSQYFSFCELVYMILEYSMGCDGCGVCACVVRGMVGL